MRTCSASSTPRLRRHRSHERDHTSAHSLPGGLATVDAAIAEHQRCTAWPNPFIVVLAKVTIDVSIKAPRQIRCSCCIVHRGSRKSTRNHFVLSAAVETLRSDLTT
jgi:hypothetical protein